jgi:hypothetical protein
MPRREDPETAQVIDSNGGADDRREALQVVETKEPISVTLKAARDNAHT